MWTCTRCTLENGPDEQACAACLTPRAGYFLVQPIATAPAPPAPPPPPPPIVVRSVAVVAPPAPLSPPGVAGPPPQRQQQERDCCDDCCGPPSRTGQDRREDCCGETGRFVGLYVVAVLVGAVAAIVAGWVGLIVLAFAPGFVILYFAERWYGSLVTRCTVAEVVGEATLILLVPLTIAIIFIDRALPMRDDCDAKRSIPFWRYFFFAYVRAALLEETLKYVSVVRLVAKPYVRDARALLVYGAIAGTTFGVLENVTYALMLGFLTAIVRSLLTVPLHCSTGIQIGANLADLRFADDGCYRDGAPKRSPAARGGLAAWAYASSTWAPTLAHGTYDVLLFIGAGECGPLRWLTVGAFLGIVPYLAYVRWRVVTIQKTHPRASENLHALLADGRVAKPCGCCDCCPPCCY